MMCFLCHGGSTSVQAINMQDSLARSVQVQESCIVSCMLFCIWCIEGSTENQSGTWSRPSAYAATCRRLTAFMKRLSDT